MRRPLLFVIGLVCALVAGSIIVSLYRTIQTDATLSTPRLITGVILAGAASLAFRLARR